MRYVKIFTASDTEHIEEGINDHINSVFDETEDIITTTRIISAETCVNHIGEIRKFITTVVFERSLVEKPPA